MTLIATIGFFDGLHLGHQAVLQTLLQKAAVEGMRPLVITFARSPYLPDNEMLMPAEERIARLQEIVGDGNVLVLDFPQVQPLTARDFMLRLKEEHQVAALLMGYDQRFGSDQPTQLLDYQHIGEEVGILVEKIPCFSLQGTPHGNLTFNFQLSTFPKSKHCRELLKQGDITHLQAVLGHPFTLSGVVCHGRGIGRKIGFPTANLDIPVRLLPPAGVYAVQVLNLNDQNLPALLNIGTNPTVSSQLSTFNSYEVHIPNYSGDLYGQTLTIALKQYIREERVFASLDKLKEQIQKDLQILTL